MAGGSTLLLLPLTNPSPLDLTCGKISPHPRIGYQMLLTPATVKAPEGGRKRERWCEGESNRGEEGMEEYLKEQEERPALDKFWKCAILSYALPDPYLQN